MLLKGEDVCVVSIAGDEVVLGAGHLESRVQLGKDCQGNARVVRSQSKMMLGDDDLDIDQGMIMRLYARY